VVQACSHHQASEQLSPTTQLHSQCLLVGQKLQALDGSLGECSMQPAQFAFTVLLRPVAVTTLTLSAVIATGPVLSEPFENAV
jgi:hypothetical protein